MKFPSSITHPISKDDLTLHILNGLGSHFHEIAAPIRARERSLSFEELHDLLVGHDAYLWRLETASQQLVASANSTLCKTGTASSTGENNRGPTPNSKGLGRDNGYNPHSTLSHFNKSIGPGDNRKFGQPNG